MKNPTSYCLVLVLTILNHSVPPSHQFESSIGSVVRGHLGALYDLRSKLGGSSAGGPTTTSSPPVLHYRVQKQQHHHPQAAPSPLKKESRGYAYHYSSSDISHPMYSPSSSFTQDFHSRMGKVPDSQASLSSSNSNKWKKSEKAGGYDKYAKLAYKSGSSGNKDSSVNSFNIHQKAKDTDKESTTPEVKTTSLPVVSPTTVPTTTSGISLGPLKSISQGLNSAVTQVLTQKLMTLLDQDVPQNILNPLRHLVASGNRMIDFWDKRTGARDGKSPGIVEMLGYGMDQLKQFRDGQELRSSDNISAATPASKALVQGMVIIKKLTNRVLGYDTDEEAGIESRGGYGGDSYGGGGGGGWGHHVSYGHYLDPYAILATLGFGVFLFNVIFNLLNNNAMMASGRSLDVADMEVPLALSDILSSSNPEDVSSVILYVYKRPEILDATDDDMGSYGGLDPFSLLAALAFGAFLLQLLLTIINTSARSLDVTDLNTPLMMSDFHMPNFMTSADKIFGTPTVRTKRSTDGLESGFFSLVDKLGGMVKAYQQVSEKPKCSRLYLCRIAVQDALADESSVLAKLTMVGLGHLSKEQSTSEFVKSIQSRVASGEDVNCDQIVQECVSKDLN